MKWAKAMLLGVVALAALAGAAAAAVPYDVSGHWSGSARQRGKSAVTLTADFTASGKSFTGTIVATGGGDPPSTCTVTGKAHRPSISVHGTCDDGGVINFHGRLNVHKQTVAGGFAEKKNGRRHAGKFTLAKAGGPVLTGAVLAPTASLASLQHRSFISTLLARLVPGAWAQSSGFVPVPDTNILVFTIGNNGKPTSNKPIATTTSDGNGRYSLSLPPGTNLGSNLLIQATSSTSPTPVGSPGQQSCPATQPVLDLSPISEYATRALIAAVASNSSVLGNYTPNEINAIIAKVTALAQDPSLVGATIQDTITNITNAIGPEIQDDLENAATPGEATAPQGLGGVYNFVDFSADDTGASLTLAQHSGTLTVDLSAKTLSFSGPKASVDLSEVCTANQGTPCNRSFTRSTSSATRSGAGSISLLGGHQILFQPSNGDDAALGFYGSSGDLIVLSTADGLVVAFKQASSVPALGGSYHGVQLDGSLSDTFTAAQGVPFNLGAASTQVNDLMTIAAGTVGGTSSKNVLTKDVTCNGGGACSYTETVSGSSSGTSFSAPVSVDATGALTVSPVGQVPHPGAVSADGSLFAFVDGDPVGNGDAGIVLGVKQGSGMTNASLSGTYGFVSYEFGLGPLSRSLSSESGIVRLDGNGGLVGHLGRRQSRVSTGCTGGFCPGNAVSQNPKTESPDTTYGVTATGGVTVVGSNTTIAGFASPDGSVLVFTEAHDGAGQGNDADSQRGVFVMVK